MSLPVLVIGGPLLAATVLLFVSRRWPIVAGLAGGLVALVLRLALAAQPLITDPATGREIAGGEWALFGRSLMLSSEHQALLLFFYTVAMFLFLLSALWPQGEEFVPAGLGLLSVIAAAFMLQPVSFGIVLLLVMIALGAVLLQSGRTGIAHGPLWYLLFTALGVPLCLLAAWMLNTQPGALYGSIWRLLFLGLLLLLAGFPFLFWVRPVFRFAAPLPIVMALAFIPLVMLWLILPLGALSPMLWVDSPLLPLFGQAGAITLGVAVVLLLYFTRDWPGLVAYTLLADLGALFLALSLGPAGQPLAETILLWRGVSLLLGGLGLGLLQADRLAALPGEPPPEFTAGKGLAWKQPLAVLLFLLGTLSLAGFPLTPGFSGRWELLTLLWSQSLPFALILILATASTLVGVIRAGRYLFGGEGRATFAMREYVQGLSRPGLISHLVLLLLLLTSLLLTLFPQLLVNQVPRLGF